jgi:hypothetical protein
MKTLGVVQGSFFVFRFPLHELLASSLDTPFEHPNEWSKAPSIALLKTKKFNRTID